MSDSPSIRWDIGTAYDFFISLAVLHDPARYGLRAAWAAGMRSRLTSADRETLEQGIDTLHIAPPLRWIHTDVPEPRGARDALDQLAELEPIERLITFTVDPESDPGTAEMYRRIAEDGVYDDGDVERAAEHARKYEKKTTRKQIAATFDIWTDAHSFGQRYLTALNSYYDVFFSEEEGRILPHLRDGLADAQALAERQPLEELLEVLSQGVRFGDPLTANQLTLVPSFWSSPYIFFNGNDKGHMIIAFGARPATASIVPGEVVPDALINALKALADPTRLRILRYLSMESLTPTQLARKLRLRAPTVIHHLAMLRVAGMVQVTVSKKEKIYGIRADGVSGVIGNLHEFLDHGEVEMALELEQAGEPTGE